MALQDLFAGFWALETRTVPAGLLFGPSSSSALRPEVSLEVSLLLLSPSIIGVFWEALISAWQWTRVGSLACDEEGPVPIDLQSRAPPSGIWLCPVQAVLQLRLSPSDVSAGSEPLAAPRLSDVASSDLSTVGKALGGGLQQAGLPPKGQIDMYSSCSRFGLGTQYPSDTKSLEPQRKRVWSNLIAFAAESNIGAVLNALLIYYGLCADGIVSLLRSGRGQVIDADILLSHTPDKQLDEAGLLCRQGLQGAASGPGDAGQRQLAVPLDQSFCLKVVHKTFASLQGISGDSDRHGLKSIQSPGTIQGGDDILEQAPYHKSFRPLFKMKGFRKALSF